MTDVLLLTFIFLVAGVVAVPIASRLGLGSVLGYLIAGILIDSSIRMGRSTYEALGIESDMAQKMSDAFEVLDRKSIATLAQYRDPDIPAVENKAYLDKVRELGGEFQKELNIQMEVIRKKDSIDTP